MESRARFSTITILIIALALLHSGEAIRCYSCSSEQSNTCANAPESYEKSDCAASVGSCMTCNGQNTEGSSFVLRGCFGILSNLVSDNMECSVCSKDLCNGNGSLPLSISVAALGGLVLLWTTRFVLIDF